VTGLDKINAACGVTFCVDLSATPFYIGGSGYPEGSPFPWIVSDFALVDAIESGITKIPRLPAADNTGRPDPKFFKLWEHVTDGLRAGERLTGGKPKPEVVFRKSQDALLTLVGQWKGRFEQIEAGAPGQDRTPPVMIIVCDNTDIAEHFHRMISGEETVVVEAEEDDDDDDENAAPRKKRKAKPVKRFDGGMQGFPELANAAGLERTRRIVSTVGKLGAPGEQVRCVVSVNMLSEGWDANNVTHILGLRAFHSQLLCEQVVGRGLRRMDYTPDPVSGLLTEEYVDIFGVPFSLIPFKGRPPGDPPPPDDRPKHEVLAMPERAAFEMRFPVVEGFVVDLQRHLVRCDVDDMERIKLNPWDTPTAAFVRPQVGYAIGSPGTQTGFGFDLVTREEYYRNTHLQTIAFEVAREVVRQLVEAAHPKAERLRSAGRATLFPQVLCFAQAYIDRRVDFNGCNPCELGLQTYAMRVVSLLADAIEPDDARGEAAILPRLNRYRPIASTASVRFKTVKPVQATTASHLNFVAADTHSWEQAAATQLEMLAKQGRVVCFARNDHLELNVPYEFYGQPRVYEPDFIVRLANGLQVVLEVKGQSMAETEAKHQAAKRWVSAVNHWGQLGRWHFEVCWDPQKLGSALAPLASSPSRSAG
jgi:type III restriction enzyme